MSDFLREMRDSSGNGQGWSRPHQGPQQPQQLTKKESQRLEGSAQIVPILTPQTLTHPRKKPVDPV